MDREHKLIKKGIADYLKAYDSWRYLRFKYVNKKVSDIFQRFISAGLLEENARIIDHLPGTNRKEYLVKYCFGEDSRRGYHDQKPQQFICTFPVSLFWADDETLDAWIMEKKKELGGI